MSSRNIHFKKVVMRNFMSYGNAPIEVDLDRSGTIQIQGRNLDDTQQGIGANGVGKSSIVNAIVYALYGEAIGSDVKVDDVINDINLKECVVSVHFKLDGDEYSITRYRKMKSGPEGNYIEVFKNGKVDPKKDNLAKATMPETNKWIEQELVDMPKELFTRLVVYDADESSFFKLPSLKQRELMENLFQLTILSEKANVLKEHQKTAKSSLSVEEASIETLKAQVEGHTEQIEKANKRIADWESNRTTDLDGYRSDFFELEQVDLDEQRSLLKKIETSKVEISELEDTIKNLSHKETQYTDKLDGIIEKLNLQIESVRSGYVAKRQELRASMMDVEQQISQEQERLEAQRNFATSLANDAKKQQAAIEGFEREIASLEETIKTQQQQIAVLNKNECPECHQQMPDASTNIKKREDKIKDVKLQIHETNKSINVHETERDRLIDECDQNNETYQLMMEKSKKEELTSQTSSIKDQIASIENQELQSINECKQSHKSDMDIIEQEIVDNKQKIAQLREKQTTIRSVEYDDLVVKDESQLVRLETEKQGLQKQIDDMTVLVNPHLEAMQDLVDNQPKHVDYTEINEYKRLIDHQQFLIKVLTDKKSFIRKKLISKRLPYLNERLTKYLKDMGLPYRVEFNSDLTPSISKRGRKKSFGVLSHGQKARVNFALSFAFRDVLTRMHRRINICLLDEVLDKALCPVGANAAVTLINEKAREDGICIFVITHKSELATKFKNHITVTLEDGFSTVQLGQVL